MVRVDLPPERFPESEPGVIMVYFHIAEIADAARPYSLRGCPFQAWSLGEFVRLKYDILKLTT